MANNNRLQALPDKIQKLQVLVAGHEAGTLAKLSHYSFRYTRENYPVSLTMPIRDEPYNSGATHPVFSQNLPEGFLRHYIYERLQRYAAVDDLYLLALMGDKGIGHLSYHAEQMPQNHSQPVALNDILHWSEPSKLFPQLLERYYLSGMASGVQPKVMISRATALQQDLIVKTYDEEFPLLTVNEYVCMRCAKYCGLDTPEVWLSDNLEHFVVARFDYNAQGQKIALEDFATLMGMTGDKKYQGSYENVLRATELNTQSTLEVQRMFQLIAFNTLIGNGDAHLKNFSLAYQPDQSAIRVSPVYDLTHTLIYPHIDRNMALKMHKSKAFPQRRDLVELAFKAGIGRTIAADIVDHLADNIIDCLVNLDQVELLPGLRESILSHLASVMRTADKVPAYRHVKRRKYPN